MRIEKDDRKLNVLSKLGLVHPRWLHTWVLTWLCFHDSGADEFLSNLVIPIQGQSRFLLKPTLSKLYIHSHSTYYLQLLYHYALLSCDIFLLSGRCAEHNTFLPHYTLSSLLLLPRLVLSTLLSCLYMPPSNSTSSPFLCWSL